MSSRWAGAYAAQVLKPRLYAEIWTGIGGTKIAGPLRMTGGTVTIDRANAIRRVAQNVTFLPDAAGALMPLVNQSGELYPLGYELKLFKGCQYTDGSTEFAQLGTFLLEESDVVDDGSSLTIAGQLKDRGQTISRAKFSTPYATDGVSTADVAIAAIINQQVPGIPMSFAGSAVVPTVSTWPVQGDPWVDAVKALAASSSTECFPNWTGTLVLQAIQTPSVLAVNPGVCATYLDGTAGAMTAMTRTISNAKVPNVIVGIAQGSGVATPLQTFWWDNDPTSKTFYAPGTPGTTLPARSAASTYPTLQAKIETSIVTTLAQLQALVNAAGLSYKGTFETIQLSIRDQPAHDVNDIVAVKRSVAGVTTLTNYILDQVVIPLDIATPTTLTGRLVLA